MFDVGFSELMLIGVVALVVIGPEKLPRVARTVGLLLGKAQRQIAEVKADINRELQLDEMRRLGSELGDSARSLQASLQEQAQEFKAALQPAQDAALELKASVEQGAALPPVPDAAPFVEPALARVEQERAVEAAPAPVSVEAPSPQGDLFSAPEGKGGQHG